MWRFFRFDAAGKCNLTAWEVPFFNDFTDLEKTLKAKKYKKVNEVEYDFLVRKAKGIYYTNGKDNYILMFDAINPIMTNSTRAIIYSKTK